MRRALVLSLALASCGGARTTPAAPPAPESAAPTVEAAPWDAPRLGLGAVPQTYLSEWQRAGNRARCPLLVPTDLGPGGAGAARREDFGLGWGVGYDVAGRTGDGGAAFGIAGTAASRGSAPAAQKQLKWADGSAARYGQSESGRHVAYLEVVGVDCVYNVWSYLGEDHLMTILRGLRRVDGM
jgi:hypothetical protein